MEFIGLDKYVLYKRSLYCIACICVRARVCACVRTCVLAPRGYVVVYIFHALVVGLRVGLHVCSPVLVFNSAGI